MRHWEITEAWIAKVSETEIRAGLRLAEALRESESKWSERTTKALYKELKRRQAVIKAKAVTQTALIFP